MQAIFTGPRYGSALARPEVDSDSDEDELFYDALSGTDACASPVVDICTTPPHAPIGRLMSRVYPSDGKIKILLASTIYPLCSFVRSIAKRFHLITAITPKEQFSVAANAVSAFIDEMFAFNATLFDQPVCNSIIDITAILSDHCPFQEYLRQVNCHLNVSTLEARVAQREPFGGVSGALIKAPLLEEFWFRHGLHTGVLRILPKAILQEISPNSVRFVDSAIAKIARILISSTAFSAWHLQGRGVIHEQVLQEQLLHTFFVGVVIGFSVEMFPNDPLLPIVLHMANNAFSFTTHFFSCDL